MDKPCFCVWSLLFVCSNHNRYQVCFIFIFSFPSVVVGVVVCIVAEDKKQRRIEQKTKKTQGDNIMEVFAYMPEDEARMSFLDIVYIYKDT